MQLSSQSAVYLHSLQRPLPVILIVSDFQISDFRLINEKCLGIKNTTTLFDAKNTRERVARAFTGEIFSINVCLISSLALIKCLISVQLDVFWKHMMLV